MAAAISILVLFLNDKNFSRTWMIKAIILQYIKLKNQVPSCFVSTSFQRVTTQQMKGLKDMETPSCVRSVTKVIKILYPVGLSFEK